MPDLWDFPGRSPMKLWDKNIKIPTTCIGIRPTSISITSTKFRLPLADRPR